MSKWEILRPDRQTSFLLRLPSEHQPRRCARSTPPNSETYSRAVLLIVCPCYQTFAVVPDNPRSVFVTRSSLQLLKVPRSQTVSFSPESAHVTRLSLSLLRSLGPRPSPFRLVLCLSRTFSFQSLTDMLLRSIGPGPSPFRLRLVTESLLKLVIPDHGMGT